MNLNNYSEMYTKNLIENLSGFQLSYFLEQRRITPTGDLKEDRKRLALAVKFYPLPPNTIGMANIHVVESARNAFEVKKNYRKTYLDYPKLEPNYNSFVTARLWGQSRTQLFTSHLPKGSIERRNEIANAVKFITETQNHAEELCHPFMERKRSRL